MPSSVVPPARNLQVTSDAPDTQSTVREPFDSQWSINHIHAKQSLAIHMLEFDCD